MSPGSAKGEGKRAEEEEVWLIVVILCVHVGNVAFFLQDKGSGGRSAEKKRGPEEGLTTPRSAGRGGASPEAAQGEGSGGRKTTVQGPRVETAPEGRKR